MIRAGASLRALFARALDPAILYTQIGKAVRDSITRHESEGLDILQVVESRIRERGVGDPEATYKIAQAYAVLGDKVAALRTLRSSVEGGFFSYPYISRDPLLDPLRKEPEFKEILGLSQRRYETFKKEFFEANN